MRPSKMQPEEKDGVEGGLVTANTVSELPDINSNGIETEETQSRNINTSTNTSTARNLPRTGATTLETVEETSTPSAALATDSDRLQIPDEKTDSARCSGESGNESSGSRSPQLVRRHSGTPYGKGNGMLPKRSFTSLSASQGNKAAGATTAGAETSMGGIMTVETETVSSVPQVSLAGGTADRGGAGTVRLQPSEETIRPKKEKKKQTRKPTVPGTMSSKADIFEAKIASAVDDVDSSDSDETFVYESNPPDQHPSHHHRYHSRTPSAVSMVSQLDQHGARTRPSLRDGFRGISNKRSMKFTNTSYNTFDGEVNEQAGGRGSSRTNSGLHTTRHHGGRHSKNGVQTPLFDQARFMTSQSTKSSTHNGNDYFKFNSRKGDSYGYDFDAEGADDERAPLAGDYHDIRGSRNGRSPSSSNIRRMEYMASRRKNCFLKYGIYLLLASLFIMLGVGGALFFVGISNPLLKVQVLGIQNILASEQQIILDLNIQAINANIFSLTITDLDLMVFAKSRYLGADSHLSTRTISSATGIDEGTGTDPIFDDDPVGDPQTMTLGRVFYFYSPLVFNSSPWNRTPTNATGQIRLSRPGNRTEEGGTQRWERILQHPFELIVRGVLEYNLPLSSKSQSTSISSKAKFDPTKDDNENKPGDDDGGGDDDNNNHNNGTTTN